MQLQEVILTLQKLINKKVTQSDIGEILNMSNTSLSNRKNRATDFKVEELRKIAEYYKIPIDSLISEKDCGVSITYTPLQFCENPEKISLDYYPDIFGSCGNGLFTLSNVKEKIQVPLQIFKFSNCYQYSVINAIGDSMTPYIMNGDKLVIRHFEMEQIKDNSIYVFCYEDEIFIKRLSKNIDEIIIKSDNPEYSTKIVPVEKINVIGEVVGLMRASR